MDDLSAIGRILLLVGLLFIIIGGFLLLMGKIPYLGRLPGDIIIKRENFTFYFPLATGIILSIVLTVIFNLLIRR